MNWRGFGAAIQTVGGWTTSMCMLLLLGLSCNGSGNDKLSAEAKRTADIWVTSGLLLGVILLAVGYVIKKSVAESTPMSPADLAELRSRVKDLGTRVSALELAAQVPPGP